MDGVRAYLAAVYPTANLNDDGAYVASLFASLQFFYATQSTDREHCITATMLHSPDVLPIAIEPCASDRAGREAREGCLGLSATAAPRSQLPAAEWYEVRHEAFGRRLPVERTRKQSSSLHSARSRRAADFMDGGPAGMWYYPAHGSGIFYRAGRSLVSPTKNEAVAVLLEAMAVTSTANALWPPHGLDRTDLCAEQAVCKRPMELARRVRQAADATRGGCKAVELRHCGNGHILGDAWDPILVWLGRCMGYDSLVLQTTLCGCGWACGPCAQRTCPPSLSNTHPEIVDLRVPDAVRWRADGLNRTLFFAGSREWLSGNAHAGLAGSLPPATPVRKHAALAADWMAHYHRSGVLTLRDPLDVNNESRARPCLFHRSTISLGCAGHPSEKLSSQSSDPQPFTPRYSSERRQRAHGRFVFHSARKTAARRAAARRAPLPT